MKFKIIRDSFGAALGASVVLKPRERDLVLGRRVDMIYSPGGLGPSLPDENGACTFGGACFVNFEANLIACLTAFGAALTAEVERQRKDSAEIKAMVAVERDEAEGFEAFPGGRFADAMRGTKSFPDQVRCPFKRPDRVAAWERGYDRAHSQSIEAAVA